MTVQVRTSTVGGESIRVSQPSNARGNAWTTAPVDAAIRAKFETKLVEVPVRGLTSTSLAVRTIMVAVPTGIAFHPLLRVVGEGVRALPDSRVRVSRSRRGAAGRAMMPPKKASTKPATRKKSRLTLAGDRAKWETERGLLLKTLKSKGWNLTHTAAELEMAGVTAVLHALDRYDLRDLYERSRPSKP